MPAPHHASAVAFAPDNISAEWHGVLLLGAAGCGKSSLAQRLMHEGQKNVRLVGDDRLYIEAKDAQLFARPHPQLAGLLEMRGLGVVRLPADQCQARARLVLAVEMVARTDVPRLAAPCHWTHDGIALPMLRLCAFDLNAAASIAFAMQSLAASGFQDIYALK